MRVLTTTASLTRLGLGAILQAALVLAIVATVAIGAALVVGHPPGASAALAASSPSAVWVTMGDATSRTAATSEVPFGSPFVVGFNTRERQPWALARCYPNATTVYTTTFADGSVWGEYYSLYAGGPVPQNFILGDGYANWTSGGADCTVELLKFSADYAKSTVLARGSFSGMP